MCLLGMKGARSKEEGDTEDSSQKKKESPAIWGTPLPRDGTGASGPWAGLKLEEWTKSLRVTVLPG